MFCKAIPAIIVIPLMFLGRVNENLWKGSTILNAINIWLMGADQIPTLTGDWKKLISTLMGDFKEFEGSVEEVTADVMEIARELELEMDTEDAGELL